jgi:hypothetical protein
MTLDGRGWSVMTEHIECWFRQVSSQLTMRLKEAVDLTSTFIGRPLTIAARDHLFAINIVTMMYYTEWSLQLSLLVVYKSTHMFISWYGGFQ